MTPSQPPPPNTGDTADDTASRAAASLSRYWRRNVRIMVVLLVIWAAVGLGGGILFADSLNAFHFGGFPLGFWIAQQGSIIVFVVLILVYAILLNRLDAQHHKELEAS